MGASSSSQGVAPNLQRRLETKDLPSLRLLGKGLSGFVYETTWKGNKYARKDFPVGSSKREIFAKEVSDLLKLEHPNVVKCIDYTVGKSSCSLLLEYVDADLQNDMQRRIEAQVQKTSCGSKSTLRNIDEIKLLLSGKVKKGEITEVDEGSSRVRGNGIPLLFNVDEAVGLISQIATGMKYLHDNWIVHGDLKPKNVLVCSESGKVTVKVADFGLVETKKRIKLVSKRTRHFEILTWKAPELFSKLLGPLTEDSDDPFTDSDTDLDEEIGSPDNFLESRLAMADVYSFGLTCVYILGGQLFFPELSLTQLRKRRSDDFKPRLPHTCPKGLKDLIYSSLESEPRSRPTFSTICTQKALLPPPPLLEDSMKVEEGEDLMPLKTLRLKQLITSEGSSSSSSTPPEGITKIDDAGYKINELTVPLEVEVVKDVVGESTPKRDHLLELPSFLVGIEDKLQEVGMLLEKHSSVGLLGMGGIGKSTLSKYFYEQEKQHFEKSCFLEKVKSFGIESSQKKLFHDFCGNSDENQIVDFDLKQSLMKIKQCIMTKKVLLVVDDVPSEENLKSLLVDAFKDGENGSRVIVTTRYRRVLYMMHIEPIFVLDLLNEEQALNLFSHYAFDQLDINEKVKLEGLAMDIITRCGGLPLCIEVVGQCLSKYNHPSYAHERRSLWEEALNYYQGDQDGNLLGMLKISYDYLNEDHKSMFLDFACILSEWFATQEAEYGQIWTSKEIEEFLGRIWGDPIGVQSLIKKSLIKWNPQQNIFVMHDLLQDLGRSIAKTTRIWNEEEGLKFMVQNKGSKMLEGLFLYKLCVDDLWIFRKAEKENLKEVECFEKLRLLSLEGSSVQVVEYYVLLCPKELRWLCLNATEITSTSIQDLGSCHKLRVLQMRRCKKLLQLPESTCNLCNLMELDLSHCYSLMSLRDSIGDLQNLQILLLEWCDDLESLPESIGMLKSLKTLNVMGCKSLKEIPAGVGKLLKLEHLNANYCTKLESLCEFGTGMCHLKELHLSRCKNLQTIKLLGNLRGLTTLDLHGCIDLYIDNLNDQLKQLSQLQYLNLGECFGLREGIVKTIQGGQLCTDHLEMLNLPVIPEGGLPPCPCLKSLYMDNGLQLMEFVVSSRNLSYLEDLNLWEDEEHPSMKVLPDALCALERLKMFGLHKFEELGRLPENIGQLSSLQQLHLVGCSSLMELPASLGHLSQLKELYIFWCSKLVVLPSSLGHLSQLEELSLINCNALGHLPESLGHLSQLSRCRLKACEALEQLPKSLGMLKCLKRLNVKGCSKLKTLHLDGCSCLTKLDLRGCSSLMRLPDSIRNLRRLQILLLEGCEALKSLPKSIDELKSLKVFNVRMCRSLKEISPGAGKLLKLEYLNVMGCSKLETLHLDGCSHLITLQLDGCSSLTTLRLDGCSRLVDLPQEIGDLTALTTLSLDGCSSLEKLPSEIGGLSSLKTLLLDSCSSLEQVPLEVGELTALTTLSLVGCSSMQQLPPEIGQLAVLTTLRLVGCSRLEQLPPEIGELTALTNFSLVSCSSIQQLPPTIGKLTALTSLRFDGCSWLQQIPHEIGNMMTLTAFSLDGCSSLENLPHGIFGNLMALTNLSLVGCSRLKHIPCEIGNLSALTTLTLNGCSSLEQLPCEIGNLTALTTLSLDGCSSVRHLPREIGNLLTLITLSLKRCSSLEALPPTIGKMMALTTLSLVCCSSLNELPSEIGNLLDLKTLNLDGCSSLKELPSGIGNLTALTTFSMVGCSNLVHLPSEIGNLSTLRTLKLDGWLRLKHLPHEIGKLVDLETLSLDGCSSLEQLPLEISELTALKTLSLDGCFRLKELPCKIGDLADLMTLSLDRCSNLKKLPLEIGNLTSLTKLSLYRCSSLTELPSEIGGLMNLANLNIEGCSMLMALPTSIGNLPSLKTLSSEGWSKLNNLSRAGNFPADAIPNSISPSLIISDSTISNSTVSDSMALSSARFSLLFSKFEELQLEFLFSNKLTTLNLDGSLWLEQLPSEIVQMTALTTLSLVGCSNLKHIPGEIGKLTALKTLRMDGCSSLKELPLEILTAHSKGLRIWGFHRPIPGVPSMVGGAYWPSG